MKIEIIFLDSSNPWMWRVWLGGRCLAWGAEKDPASARIRAQAVMKEAKRTHVVRWPRRAASR